MRWRCLVCGKQGAGDADDFQAHLDQEHDLGTPRPVAR